MRGQPMRYSVDSPLEVRQDRAQANDASSSSIQSPTQIERLAK
jgi:hypothetical protein